MDARYWFSPVKPPSTGKIGCGIRRKSKRRTADTYRSGPARERRRLRRQYAASGVGGGFKAWLRAGAQVAA